MSKLAQKDGVVPRVCSSSDRVNPRVNIGADFVITKNTVSFISLPG